MNNKKPATWRVFYVLGFGFLKWKIKRVMAVKLAAETMPMIAGVAIAVTR